MGQENGEKALPKEVIICRFGSAFSTLTVALLDKEIPDKIQETLAKLDETKALQQPALVVNERICFRNSSGRWTRARILHLNDDPTNENTTVDLILEDTRDVFRRVSDKAIVAMPEAVQALGRPVLYFVEGLRPYEVAIVTRASTKSTVAQACADALNKEWQSIPKSTRLTRVTPPSEELGFARRTRLFTASLLLNGKNDLRSYIQKYLLDFQLWISPTVDYIRKVKHPKVALRNYCSSILVPYTSKKEMCEVVFLRKTDDNVLKVGLRLSHYVDLEIIVQSLLRGLKPLPVSQRPIEAFEPVVVAKGGVFEQRGVALESGRILCIDTLEVIDPDGEDIQLRRIPEGVADAFPHTGLIIDWKPSENSQTLCIGDSVIATNLSPRFDSKELLEYSCDDLIRQDHSTVLGYHPQRAPRQLKPSVQERSQKATEKGPQLSKVERPRQTPEKRAQLPIEEPSRPPTERHSDSTSKKRPHQGMEQGAQPTAEYSLFRATDEHYHSAAEDRRRQATRGRHQPAAEKQVPADRKQELPVAKKSSGKKGKEARPKFAEWYELNPLLKPAFADLPSPGTFQACEVDALLSMFGESLPPGCF